jgi:hypothetical protein
VSRSVDLPHDALTLYVWCLGCCPKAYWVATIVGVFRTTRDVRKWIKQALEKNFEIIERYYQRTVIIEWAPRSAIWRNNLDTTNYRGPENKLSRKWRPEAMHRFDSILLLRRPNSQRNLRAIATGNLGSQHNGGMSLKLRPWPIRKIKNKVSNKDR